MRPAHLFVYICIFLALVGYYCYFEVYIPGLKKDSQDDIHTIFSIDPSAITQITINGGEAITLVKKDSSWRLTSPVEEPADGSQVEDLVRAAVSMKPVRTLGDMVSSEDLGLDPPDLGVSFKTGDAEFSLYIGLQTPTKNFCYARSSTRGDIFLIDAYEKTRLNKDVFTLRDKHVFSMNYADVSRITITRHRLILDFVKDAGGGWKLSSDPVMRIKTSAVNGLLDSFCRLEARGYICEQPHGSDPDITVKLGSGDKSQSLLLWQKPYDGENIIALSEVQDSPVLLRDSIPGMIPSDPAEVTDRSVVDMDTARVRKIIVSDGNEHVFTMHAGGWLVGGEPIADAAAVDAVLTALSKLEYTDQYMKIPDDVRKEGAVQIFYDDPTPVFDIGLYSQYYVVLGDRIYRIHEGAMKIVEDSVDMLVHSKR